MKSHQHAAAFLGILAVYLAAHAGMGAYGLYLAHSVLNFEGSTSAPDLADLREKYELMIVILPIMSSIIVLAAASSVGLLRRKAWAAWLCLGATTLLIGCVAVAGFAFSVPWKNYWFELALAAASCWFTWSPKLRTHAG